MPPMLSLTLVLVVGAFVLAVLDRTKAAVICLTVAALLHVGLR